MFSSVVCGSVSTLGGSDGIRRRFLVRVIRPLPPYRQSARCAMLDKPVLSGKRETHLCSVWLGRCVKLCDRSNQNHY